MQNVLSLWTWGCGDFRKMPNILQFRKSCMVISAEAVVYSLKSWVLLIGLLAFCAWGWQYCKKSRAKTDDIFDRREMRHSIFHNLHGYAMVTQTTASASTADSKKKYRWKSPQSLKIPAIKHFVEKFIKSSFEDYFGYDICNKPYCVIYRAVGQNLISRQKRIH